MGVGAVEGLRGEILVLDGVPYVSAVGPDGKPVTSTGSAADVAATLLILADVPAWRELPIDRAIDSKEFDTTIRELALRAGVDVQAPFPFVVTGRAMSLEGHVINRACPTASANGSRDQHAPHRLAGIHDQEVTLVGFYAESGAGVITHHDSRTHVHVLLREGSPMVAHVESVSLAGGACFKLPYRNR